MSLASETIPGKVRNETLTKVLAGIFIPHIIKCQTLKNPCSLVYYHWFELVYLLSKIIDKDY